MQGLKIGDIVRVGGAAHPDFKKRNVGKFRTVVGFGPSDCTVRAGGLDWICDGNSVYLDQPLLAYHDLANRIVAVTIVPCTYLVKINPGDGEDEILTKVGKPRDFVVDSGKPKQTKHLEQERAFTEGS